MHEDELSISAATVSGLLQAQFPQWAELPVERLAGAGTDNAIFRIGVELTARFPLRADEPDHVRQRLEAEAAASAEFATVAGCAAPVILAIGDPGQGYPLPWSVQTWVPGTVASPRAEDNDVALAVDLAQLIRRLRSADTRGRGFSGLGRGGELPPHDKWVGHCINESEGMIETGRARSLWAWFRQLPSGATPVMSHKDLIPANILVDDGRLTGVLDTGGFGPADPALDLVVAWHLFDEGPRQILRDELACDDVEWARGAAWAFQQAMGLIWYYVETNPPMSELGLSTLCRLFASPELQAN